MAMKISKHDIGAEVMSILTRGMYLDPMDAMREYIQNGVDAGAKNISIKIRQMTIVVEDDGLGMDKDTMRKAVRLGISDKNPKKKVGFMGIGIYSSFHICNKLVIYSKTKNENPYKLVFDFEGMRLALDRVKEERLKNRHTNNTESDLQTLLSENIDFVHLKVEDFPERGTRVEMIGVEANFFKSLTKFSEVENYLQHVVPLPFSPDFKWSTIVEAEIEKICKKHRASFELINLTLQINDMKKELYRPYSDKLFDDKSLKPFFCELKTDDNFFGVAWGCLNSSRSVIKNKELRGFTIKKQGFGIGTSHNLIKYFGSQKFFNRYVGEIIVVDPYLLPNASRTDFEFSQRRNNFYNTLIEAANFFNTKGNEHQEVTKSDDDLDNAIDFVKKNTAQLEYYVNNSDKLLSILVELQNYNDSISKRVKKGVVRKSREKDAQTILKLINKMIKEASGLLSVKNKKKTLSELKTGNNLAKIIKNVPKKKRSKAGTHKPKSLVDVLELSGIETSSDLRAIFDLIDQQFIQPACVDSEDYCEKLHFLLNEIEEMVDEQ